MDKYMCRAKRIDNSEWVYGYYFERKDIMGNIIEAVIIEDAYEQIHYGLRVLGSRLNKECFRVDPDTVCRYTGMTEFVMTDKSVNSPLFEGDIVEVWSRRRPIGENITLYRDNTTSKYDVEIKARAVICFDRGQWCLDYDNAYNNSICELKGNEQNERTVKSSPNLYDFGIHKKDSDWFREHNQHCKWHDIVRIGNNFDNIEVMEVIK